MSSPSPTLVRLSVPKPRGCQSLIAWDHGTHVELSLLVVYPAKRRQGVGSEALARLKQAAGGRRVVLQVDRPKQRGLKRFYGAAGFRSTGGLAMEWEPGEWGSGKREMGVAA